MKELARNRLPEIEQKIRELQTLRNELRGLLRRKVRRFHPGELCPLIEHHGRVKVERQKHLEK